MLLTAIAIKAYDRGLSFCINRILLYKRYEGILYSEIPEHAGGCGKGWAARLASKHDDRITHYRGKFIRMVRIDELPQLFNILKGEMTFIMAPVRNARRSSFSMWRICRSLSSVLR